MKDDLEAVGIGRGITETIATTISSEKKGSEKRFNAAPVGLVNKEVIYVEIFKESHTHENLIETGKIGINIVYDPVIFVESTFDDLKDNDYCIIDGFPFIKESYAVLKFSVVQIEDKKLSSRFLLRLLFRKIRKTGLIGINRGFNLLLELLILASRRKITNRYKEIYPVYSPVIRKCGDERVIKALELLENMIKE